MPGSGNTSGERIRAALEARLSPQELTPEEYEMWLSAFVEALGKPSEAEEAFFARRRELGLGVGLNEAGELVWGDRASSESGS